MPHSKALLCCCFHLPYTGRWYRVSWAYATCPRLGGRRLRGPGTSVGCHTTGCRPGRGLWRSAGNTRPPPLLCTRTSTRGKPEASSPPPPPADTESGEKKKKELSRHKCKRVCALVFWVWTSWSGDCSYSLHAGLLPRLITEVGLIWASTRSWATDQGKVLKKKQNKTQLWALNWWGHSVFSVMSPVSPHWGILNEGQLSLLLAKHMWVRADVHVYWPCSGTAGSRTARTLRCDRVCVHSGPGTGCWACCRSQDSRTDPRLDLRSHRVSSGSTSAPPAQQTVTVVSGQTVSRHDSSLWQMKLTSNR